MATNTRSIEELKQMNKRRGTYAVISILTLIFAVLGIKGQDMFNTLHNSFIPFLTNNPFQVIAVVAVPFAVFSIASWFSANTALYDKECKIEEQQKYAKERAEYLTRAENKGNDEGSNNE